MDYDKIEASVRRIVSEDLKHKRAHCLVCRWLILILLLAVAGDLWGTYEMVTHLTSRPG